MSNRRCPKCGEEYSDTYRSCPFCEEEEAIKRGHPPRRSGRRVEKRPNARSGGAGGIMLLLTGIIILGVVGYVVFGDDVADAVGIRDNPEPAYVSDGDDKIPAQPDYTLPEPDDSEPDPAVEPGAEDTPEQTDGPSEPAGPLALSQTDITIPAGETGRLTATGGNGSITWTSSNPEIASVEGGSVTGKAGGTVTITATSGEETATCKVKVEGAAWVDPNLPDLRLNKDDFTLRQSDPPVQMKLLIKETRNVYDGAVVWASNNTSVAAISEAGVVTWAGRGTTTITATVGDKVFECIVRAK